MEHCWVGEHHWPSNHVFFLHSVLCVSSVLSILDGYILYKVISEVFLEAGMNLTTRWFVACRKQRQVHIQHRSFAKKIEMFKTIIDNVPLEVNFSYIKCWNNWGGARVRWSRFSFKSDISDESWLTPIKNSFSCAKRIISFILSFVHTSLEKGNILWGSPGRFVLCRSHRRCWTNWY